MDRRGRSGANGLLLGVALLGMLLVSAADAAAQRTKQVYIQSAVVQVRANDFEDLGVDFGALLGGVRVAERNARVQATIGKTFRGVEGVGITNFMSEVQVDLLISPTITSEDDVTLLIRPRVMPFATAGLGLERQSVDIGTFSSSQTNTVFTVGAGASIAIGGLERDPGSSGSKVPVLGNVALLQHFYSGGSETVLRAGLQVFISPHIMRTEN